jgi:hypothetical protein
MGITVREVDAGEEKSAAQIEEVLLKKHEQQFGDPNESTIVDKIKADESRDEMPQLKEEDVLSFIGERYGKTITSMDELMEKRETSEELPEDVSAYFKYKKETGRGINDFVKLNKDYSDESPDKVLADYYLATEEGLDAEDVSDMIEEFTYDEDLDEDSDIKKKKLAKKREVTKAKKFFEEEKEKYKLPLESSRDGLSINDQKDLESYKDYLTNAKSVDEESDRRVDFFIKKTDEVFNNDFKGFDFEVGDKKLTYSPSTVEELKRSQSDISNFIKKYMGDDGLINDAVGYHKALSMAMNPERFAKYFYEQGKSDAVTSDAKNSKNTDLELRRTPESSRKGGLQIKALSQTSNNNGLRIKSNKRQ